MLGYKIYISTFKALFWILLLTVSGFGLDASSSVVVSALVVMVRLPVVTRQIPRNIQRDSKYQNVFRMLPALRSIHYNIEY